MKKLFAPLLALLLLTGCVLPKAVEFGQDKVQKFPVAKPSEVETQRQVAQRASQKANETLRAAIATQAEPVVVKPAAETAVLTEAVTTSLGPPLKPANTNLTSVDLAKKLDTSVAKLNARIDDFKADNNQNAGKRIEGTGFLQLPYFVYLGLILVFGVIGWVVVRVALTMLKVSNPGVALGVNVAEGVSGALASKAVGQLVHGGQIFKGWLKTEIPELSNELKDKVEQLFLDAHKTAHDSDVKQVVKNLIQ